MMIAIVLILLVLSIVLSIQLKEGFDLGKVFFFTNVLLQEEYQTILKECALLKPYLKEETSPNVKRKTIVLESPTPLHTIFYGDNFLTYLYTLLGFRVKPSCNLPIEFRMYENGGKMDWHRDSVHNNQPQIEIVFTLENTSDSKTLWRDEDAHETHEIVTQPNSILITQGNGAFHKVTPVTTGYRSIIKIAYDIA